MPFFDYYPYTNSHNINLDWVLQRVKEWGKLVEENNTAFHNLEEAFDNFKNYVTSYLENLDVQDEIDHKLDEMLASGELMEYLEPYINGLAFPEYLPIDVLYNKVNYDNYNIVQGGCSDGNYLYVCYTQTDNDESIILKKLNISTFALVQQRTINTNHGNGIAYYNGMLYVTDYDYKIHVVNAETLIVENTIQLNYRPLAICFNSNNNAVVVGVNFVTYEFSLPNFEIVREMPHFETELRYGANQINIEYHDKYYYILFSGPICLYIYDDDFNLVKIVNIKDRYERITLCEAEFITYVSDDNFIIGWNQPLLPTRRIAGYPIILENTFTVTNFTKGNSNNTEQTVNDQYMPNSKPYIYVDSSYNGNYSNGDWRYPYKEVQQALNNVNIEGSSLIICLKTGNYCPVYAVDKSFMFSTYPNQSTPQNLHDSIINSITLVSCEVHLGDVKLTPHEGAGNYALRLEQGTICWANITQLNDYNAYITTNSNLVTHGYNIPVSMASGLYTPNSFAVRDASEIVKYTGTCRILGRVLMYNGTEKTGEITLSNGNLRDYVLPMLSCYIDNNCFNCVINQSGVTILPFLYYSSNDKIEGCFKVTVTNAGLNTITVELKATKNNVTYNPASFNWIIDGIL